jgi:iron complex outermembrane receptor protein
MTHSHFARSSLRRRQELARKVAYAIVLWTFGNSAPLLAQETSRPADAQAGGLEEVIVTTTRRQENVRDVPQSVSVLTGDDLAKRSIVSVEQYTSFIPGLSFNRTGFGDRAGLDLTVRGISNSRLADVSAGAGALTTGFYIDDIAVQPVDVFMYDIARIEVLKGPQGTLFGQASMGGTVRMITNQPDATRFAASSEISLADTKDGGASWGIHGMLNLPLKSDVLALRVVAYTDEEGGFVDWRPGSLEPGAVRGALPTVPPDYPGDPLVAAQNNVEDVNSREVHGARLSMSYTPNDKLTITPFYMFQEKNDDFSGFIDRNLNQGYVTERYLPEPRNEAFQQAAITVDYKFPFASLTAISGRFNRDYRFTQDTTNFIVGTYGRTDAGGIASVSFIDFDFDTTIASQELRLTSNPSTRLDWVVGAAYIDEDRMYDTLWLAPTHNANVPLARRIPGGDQGLYSAGNTRATFESLSFFGDVTLKFFDERLQLSAGARWFDQEFWQQGISTGAGANSVGVAAIGPARTGSESDVIPRLAVKYSFAEGDILYASAAQGFRGGGPGAAPANLQTAACLAALATAGLSPGGIFKSDSVESYEVGTKTSWANRRLSLDVAAFFVDWTDLQTNLIMNNFNNGCSSTVTTNAGKATSKGAEVAMAAYPTDGLSINAAVTYTKAELGEPPVGIAVGAKGDRLQNAPEWQATLSGQQEFPILDGAYGGFIRTDLSYYGDQISNQANQSNPFFYVPDRFVVNVRFGFRPNTEGSWEAELFVNNLFDEKITYGAQSFFGEPFTNQATVGRPQNYGLVLRKSW